MEGAVEETTTEKSQAHPGNPQATVGRMVTRSMSDRAVPRVINARTDTTPTVQKSGETFRGDASGIELGIPG